MSKIKRTRYFLLECLHLDHSSLVSSLFRSFYLQKRLSCSGASRLSLKTTTERTSSQRTPPHLTPSLHPLTPRNSSRVSRLSFFRQSRHDCPKCLLTKPHGPPNYPACTPKKHISRNNEYKKRLWTKELGVE